MQSSRLIDQIFARMLVRYGAAWTRQWGMVDEEAVKADWERELGAMPIDAIRYALDNLPTDFPPTVTAFKAVAANRPRYFKALPAPKADPARVAEILSRLKSMTPGGGDRFDWAYALQEREKNGENLTEAERRMWRAALEVAPIESVCMSFNRIPQESLPPGMKSV